MMEKYFSKLVAGLMIGIMAFLTVVSVLFRSYIDVTYQEIIHYRQDNAIIAVLFLIAAAAILCLLYKKGWLKKIQEKPLLVMLLIYVAVVSGLWAYTTYSVPTADQASILACVDGLIHGNYECMQPMSDKGYLQYNTHQVGITAFYELFTRIFTGGAVNYRAIYGLNVVMIVGIFWGLYLITKKLSKDKEAVILELLFSFGLFQLMLYSNFVYGLIPGLFFAVFGIYYLLKLLETKKWTDGCALAVFCALAVVMKSNYLIFVIATGITLVLKAISDGYPRYVLYLILGLLLMTGINMTVKTVYEQRTGIEFGDTIPNSAYVAMGMQEGPSASGWFNGFNHVTYRLNGYDEEITDQLAKEAIAERFREFAENPLECISFYYKKIVSQWNEVTYESFWISNNTGGHSAELSAVVQSLYTGKLHTLAEAFMNLYQLFMFAGTLCMAWCMRKEKNLSKLILLLCILGGFLFHILWEGKSQYIITYFPLMVPCAALGVIRILKLGGTVSDKN